MIWPLCWALPILKWPYHRCLCPTVPAWWRQSVRALQILRSVIACAVYFFPAGRPVDLLYLCYDRSLARLCRGCCRTFLSLRVNLLCRCQRILTLSLPPLCLVLH